MWDSGRACELGILGFRGNDDGGVWMGLDVCVQGSARGSERGELTGDHSRCFGQARLCMGFLSLCRSRRLGRVVGWYARPKRRGSYCGWNRAHVKKSAQQRPWTRMCSTKGWSNNGRDTLLGYQRPCKTTRKRNRLVCLGCLNYMKWLSRKQGAKRR